MSRSSFLKIFTIGALAIYSSCAYAKIGIVFLHGLGGNAQSCKEWINFALKSGIRTNAEQCAVYIPEAKNNSWFDVNPLLPDLIRISDPSNQTPENIGSLLNKIKDMAPQFRHLKSEIQHFMKREGISIENLHFVGYSQGGILAQLLAYSLPESCGSLCFAGCPWIWMPGEKIQKPLSIVMAINKDDPYFGNVYSYSRNMFMQKVGAIWFRNAVHEVISQEGGHEISHAAMVAGTQHFKEILKLDS
ncbi:MAG: alpha/beta hydrolase [Pseudomonadota bacterium]|jgi:predicted esterase|nr:hypothetical protein [Alphaproteobacteria bacterium]